MITLYKAGQNKGSGSAETPPCLSQCLVLPDSPETLSIMMPVDCHAVSYVFYDTNMPQRPHKHWFVKDIKKISKNERAWQPDNPKYNNTAFIYSINATNHFVWSRVIGEVRINGIYEGNPEEIRAYIKHEYRCDHANWGAFKSTYGQCDALRLYTVNKNILYNMPWDHRDFGLEKSPKRSAAFIPVSEQPSHFIKWDANIRSILKAFNVDNEEFRSLSRGVHPYYGLDELVNEAIGQKYLELAIPYIAVYGRLGHALEELEMNIDGEVINSYLPYDCPNNCKWRGQEACLEYIKKQNIKKEGKSC